MISAIVCADLNNAIGYKGELLERIPEDMHRFKYLTSKSALIMGRKTWESLPKKPLPDRLNCVITSDSDMLDAYLDKMSALTVLRASGEKIKLEDFNPIYTELWYIKEFLENPYIGRPRIFIIGGGQIYKELLPYCDCVYLTRILHKYPNADTYFPDIESMPEWKRISCSEVKQWCDVQYQFELYERIEGES